MATLRREAMERVSSAVETAQSDIAKLTQEVAQQGRITIVGANETMV